MRRFIIAMFVCAFCSVCVAGTDVTIRHKAGHIAKAVVTAPVKMKEVRIVKVVKKVQPVRIEGRLRDLIARLFRR